jgi:urocanate hydratase
MQQIFGHLYEQPEAHRPATRPHPHDPRSAEKTSKTWIAEAAYRMIQNNLDPEASGRQCYRDPLVTSPSDGHVAFWTDWNLIETK